MATGLAAFATTDATGLATFATTDATGLVATAVAMVANGLVCPLATMVLAAAIITKGVACRCGWVGGCRGEMCATFHCRGHSHGL